MKPEAAAVLEKLKKKSSRSKMHNVRVQTEDGLFDSKAELKRYRELQLLEKAGEIHSISRQVRIPLLYEGQRIGVYVADFIYLPSEAQREAALYISGLERCPGFPDKEHFQLNPAVVVEDVKGMQTPLFRWKAKHLKAQYGVDIVIIKDKERKNERVPKRKKL